MLRRLFKTGNSVVLSLPREMLDSLNLADGDQVSLALELEQRHLVITPVEKPRAAGVDEEFARQVAEFIEEYRPALEELAK
jgi:antitoxin MazE